MLYHARFMFSKVSTIIKFNESSECIVCQFNYLFIKVLFLVMI